MLLAEALAEVNAELFNSWHLARANPEAFKAQKTGAERVIRKAEALLTSEEIGV